MKKVLAGAYEVNVAIDGILWRVWHEKREFALRSLRNEELLFERVPKEGLAETQARLLD